MSLRYMLMVKGMYSIMTRQSATAIPVRIRLMGLLLMFLLVSTIKFTMLKAVPTRQTPRDR